jgi:hypothetical protein
MEKSCFLLGYQNNILKIIVGYNTTKYLKREEKIIESFANLRIRRNFKY